MPMIIDKHNEYNTTTNNDNDDNNSQATSRRTTAPTRRTTPTWSIRRATRARGCLWSNDMCVIISLVMYHYVWLSLLVLLSVVVVVVVIFARGCRHLCLFPKPLLSIMRIRSSTLRYQEGLQHTVFVAMSVSLFGSIPTK